MVTGVPKLVPQVLAATVACVRTRVVTTPEFESAPADVTVMAIDPVPLDEFDPVALAAVAFTVIAPAEGADVSSLTIVVRVDGVPNPFVVVRT
jgi:hypothetical protein